MAPQLELSPEGQINLRLAALDCSVLAFCKLSEGIYGRSKITVALTDSAHPLPSGVIDRLSERISEMEDLQKAVAPCPVNWSKVGQVGNALLLRMTAKAAIDLGLSEPELQKQASWATQRIKEAT